MGQYMPESLSLKMVKSATGGVTHMSEDITKGEILGREIKLTLG
jgi:hypothetical protein